jgi:hypothetical protein
MAGNKSKSKRGGSTTAPKTTARKGTTKSASARAKSQAVRSEDAGRGETSAGKSRTVGKPVSSAKATKPGPGNVRTPEKPETMKRHSNEGGRPKAR